MAVGIGRYVQEQREAGAVEWCAGAGSSSGGEGVVGRLGRERSRETDRSLDGGEGGRQGGEQQ